MLSDTFVDTRVFLVLISTEGLHFIVCDWISDLLGKKSGFPSIRIIICIHRYSNLETPRENRNALDLRKKCNEHGNKFLKHDAFINSTIFAYRYKKGHNLKAYFATSIIL